MIIGLAIIIIGVGWTTKHPKHLPIDIINIESARLRQQEHVKDNIENILNDLESFHFKRDRRFGNSVGWTLAINWNDHDEVKWITLYDNCIEYERYIYITEHVDEYSEYWSQLLKSF